MTHKWEKTHAPMYIVWTKLTENYLIGSGEYLNEKLIYKMNPIYLKPYNILWKCVITSAVIHILAHTNYNLIQDSYP